MRAIITRTVDFILRDRLGIWFAVVAGTLLFGLFEFAVSAWLLELRIPASLHCSIHAVIVALGAGFSLWLILNGIVDRQRMREDELRRVAELNHTLRNALEIIVLSHHSATDYEHKAMVLECTNRIDRKMRELFPGFGNSRIVRKNGKWEIRSVNDRQ